MANVQIDHLVVAANSLEQGVTHLQEMLGVTVPFGGRHPHMGTHNCLMSLGETCYLEIIAIDPEAPPPPHPRWFALDDPETQARLAERPRMHTWICRTSDIEETVAKSAVSPGEIREGRRGDLVWQSTVPEDGSMPMGGLFPTFIQWPESLMPNGPAANMPDLGCRLESLTLTHSEPDRLSKALEATGLTDKVRVKPATETDVPGLEALIETPRGTVALT